MVIGHHADPLHPFSDSGMLVEELPNAKLIEAKLDPRVEDLSQPAGR